MITLTRLSGTTFALNADLIERIDATPDTVITLVDGKKYVVVETIEEIVDAVRRHRGEIIAASTAVAVSPLAPEPEPRGRTAGQQMGTVTELRTQAQVER